MKRFWLFFGEFYYPAGGMEDFVGSFDTVPDATVIAMSKKLRPDSSLDRYWFQIVDSVDGKVVKDEDTN